MSVWSAGDYAELEKGVASIPGQLGKPEAVLARAGYVNGDAFERLQQEGVEIYRSVHREDAHNERHYDFRPEKASGRAVKEPVQKRHGAQDGPVTPIPHLSIPTRTERVVGYENATLARQNLHRFRRRRNPFRSMQAPWSAATEVKFQSRFQTGKSAVSFP